MTDSGRKSWQPSLDQMQHWPSTSGNAINGVGERVFRRPSPVYWHPPETIPHGPLQTWFYQRTSSAGQEVREARLERQKAIDEPLEPVSATSAQSFGAAEVKAFALQAGADDVGITPFLPQYVFAGFPVPQYDWMIVIALEHAYEAMKTAPSVHTLVEVTRQYARGIRVAKRIANWLRARGADAHPYGGPMAGSFVLIPAAIEAGLGELGKHGSMIHRTLGANFRLACVLTNAELTADSRQNFGADEFCVNCRICADACPPQAIVHQKQWVRGETRWYVDFDKCLPYFNEFYSCAICIAVCPFSRPGVGANLVRKLAVRRARRG
jgi:ferredoxin